MSPDRRPWKVSQRSSYSPHAQGSKAPFREARCAENAVLVGATGFEPATPCSQSRCAPELRYAPIVAANLSRSELYRDRPARQGQRGAPCFHGTGPVPFSMTMIPALYVGPGAKAAARAAATALLGDASATHPDVRILIPDGGELGIDLVRDVILWARYGPVRAPHKVAVIGPAERLTREAANALLKLLEEMPPHLRAVLFAEALDRVPPTVRSRCALVWCSGARAQLQEALHGVGYSDDESAFIAALLDDRVEEAAAFLAERRDPLREWEEANSEAQGLPLAELVARFASCARDPLRRRAFGRHLAEALPRAATDEILAAMERLASDGKGAVAAFLDELAHFLVVEGAGSQLSLDARLSWARKASLSRGELDDNVNPRLLAEVVALWPRRG